MVELQYGPTFVTFGFLLFFHSLFCAWEECNNTHLFGSGAYSREAIEGENPLEKLSPEEAMPLKGAVNGRKIWVCM